MEVREKEPPRSGPELVIGLIAPLGTDLDMVIQGVEKSMSMVNYATKRISLIEEALDLLSQKDEVSTETADKRYSRRMDAGNELRKKFERNDALALLAISKIREIRQQQPGLKNDPNDVKKEPPPTIPRCAYVLRSLKTPQEVETLRKTYGPNFLAISVYLPRDKRRDWLTQKIAVSNKAPDKTRFRSQAEQLIERDQFEAWEYGQNIQETFPLADFFVNASDRGSTLDDIDRFIALIFGHPSKTPKRAEAAMFHAYGAKLRSSSAGRQVGAAIVSMDGELLAVGTNEVARAGGGQYWADEEKVYDRRDYRRGNDSNTEMIDSILHDLFARLQKRNWLTDSWKKLDLKILVEEAKKNIIKEFKKEEVCDEDPLTFREKALVSKVIEFMRPVHAEMAAIVSCARRGIPIDGSSMYVTAFPCHECARLIVASGVRNVFFIEPYPKSRVVDLFDDSIIVDGDGDANRISFRAFTGVAPRRYLEVFEFKEPIGLQPNIEVVRKDEKGDWVDWDKVREKREPRSTDSPVAISRRETDVLDELNKLLARLDSC